MLWKLLLLLGLSLFGQSAGRDLKFDAQEEGEAKLSPGFAKRLTKIDHNYTADTPLGKAPDFIKQIYQVPSDGGSKTIAVVIPFHYATAQADLTRFSKEFNLPDCSGSCFQVVASKLPNCGWEQEAALDLQWAHAMAPRAHLLLVEVDSLNPADLFPAVRKAAQMLIAQGGGQVIMTWPICKGYICESRTETKYDDMFIEGVTYFAASGDYSVPSYPSTSTKVIGVGGTAIKDPDPKHTVEEGWGSSGGGDSLYEKKPDFQQNVEHTSSAHRSAPDIALTANDDLAVYYTSSCPDHVTSGWQAGGNGTSAATPIAAGMANLAGSRNSSVAQELANIYSNRKDSKHLRDVTAGYSGNRSCARYFDTVTGVGAPLGIKFDHR